MPVYDTIANLGVSWIHLQNQSERTIFWQIVQMRPPTTTKIYKITFHCRSAGHTVWFWPGCSLITGNEDSRNTSHITMMRSSCIVWNSTIHQLIDQSVPNERVFLIPGVFWNYPMIFCFSSQNFIDSFNLPQQDLWGHSSFFRECVPTDNLSAVCPGSALNPPLHLPADFSKTLHVPFMKSQMHERVRQCPTFSTHDAQECPVSTIPLCAR